MTNHPVIILVRPQMGENIGAAARVAKNFGLRELRLVAPRDGWPNPKAVSMAANAADVVEAATIYASTKDAIADLHSVYATTARERYMEKPACYAADAFTPLPEGRVGILFGAERTGLDNEDVALADQILSVPVDADYPSLNLAQAVAIVTYEWFRQSAAGTVSAPIPDKASKGEMQGLFDHLETELDARNFWKVEGKKPIMWRNIRNMLQRAELSDQETRTFRGMIRCLSEFVRK